MQQNVRKVGAKEKKKKNKREKKRPPSPAPPSYGIFLQAAFFSFFRNINPVGYYRMMPAFFLSVPFVSVVMHITHEKPNKFKRCLFQGRGWQVEKMNIPSF
jgi:hypothetical protein